MLSSQYATESLISNRNKNKKNVFKKENKS